MKKTIKEMRAEEIRRLAELKNSNSSDADIAAAATLMNSFYRFVGLRQELVWLGTTFKRKIKCLWPYNLFARNLPNHWEIFPKRWLH